MRLKISEDLYVGSQELNNIQSNITKEGFYFDFQSNYETFGVVKNKILDPNFQYLKTVKSVTAGSVEVLAGYAFDKFRNRIRIQANEAKIAVPANNLWHFIVISNAINNLEVGTVSINTNGLLVGTNTKFTETLRGQPDFPTKIRFKDSINNISDYEVLQVIDDTTAYLQGDFSTSESALRYSVIGTFSPDFYPDADKELIYENDYFRLQIIEETSPTVASLTENIFFKIAKVKNDGVNIEIQDLRKSCTLASKADNHLSSLFNISSKLVGMEYLKKVELNGGLYFILGFDWKFNIENENKNLADCTVSITAGKGGVFKDINAFSTNDFNGWRVYYSDGDYSNILQSIKKTVGTGFDLYLDDIKNQPIVSICPPAESIEIEYELNKTDSIVYHKEKCLFQITADSPTILIDSKKLYKPNQTVRLTYKLKNINKSSTKREFNYTTFYDTSAFDTNGNLIAPANTADGQFPVLSALSTTASTSVPKRVPLPYFPDVSSNWRNNFDDTGLGIIGEFIGWAICNGNNTTPDLRNLTPLGASFNIPDLDAPSLSTDALTYGIEVGQFVGSSKHTLTINEMPEHDHGYIGVDTVSTAGGSSSDRKCGDFNKTTGKRGGNQAHENRQPSFGCVWIIRI